jgi:PAS domain S-box-containing protein
MRPPSEPKNEAERLEALRSYGILDSGRDEAFEALVRAAASTCDVPMAALTLIDAKRQWFLASVGIDVAETPREVSFCGHAILEPGLMVVEDAERDERFTGNALVAGVPNVRFYASATLVDRAGFALGTLCVFDRRPRKLEPHQLTVLAELSTAIVRLLEARKVDDAVYAAELSAKTARADLAVVLDAVAGTVAYWDQDHRNRFANGAYLEWFGLRGESARGRHLREVVGVEMYEQNLPHLERALRGERQRFERNVVDASGRKRHVVIAYTPDIRDGQVLGVIASMTDVTDLADALLTSQRRTELLELAEQLAEVGHWRIERGKEEIFWSSEVYRILGRDPATFIPTLTRAIDSYHPDDRATVRAHIERAFELLEPFTFELRIIRPDGQIRRVNAKGRCEVDPSTGTATAVVGVFRDITENEALRETLVRQARLVTTGTLAAGVGHEINNPLTYVGANIEFALGAIRSLAEAAPSPQLTELIEVLDEARDGAERIGKIVRGLRAFARENAPLVPVDVHAAIDIAVNMAVHELRGRVNITKELRDVPLVLGDESRLSQVFLNLIVNAAQSFPTKDLEKNRLVIRTTRLDDGRVAVEVEDNGVGIPEDVVPRIFDPFFSTKAIGQGTGLGLSISHSIVASLGGDITCHTELGKGTTFRVVLVSAGESPAEVKPRSRGTSESLGARVLVVDDEEAVLRAIARLLRPENEVVALSDAREALRMLESGEQFDVILCDLMMPNLTGMELYARIEARSPKVAERFVFITGGTIHEDVRAFLARVPNERLEKPFSKGTLRDIARRFSGAFG